MLWSIPFTLFGQRYISGQIADDIEGNPISAATVFIAGSTSGTQTDADGYYQLNISGEGSYLFVVSYRGYQKIIKDIEPGSESLVFDTYIKMEEVEEVNISTEIRNRKRDIDFFWSSILGKKPSVNTIHPKNPEAVFCDYNPRTHLLKVTSREPLHIVNNETGYHIQFHLDYFIHDYSTDLTDWEAQSFFTELVPATLAQKKQWEQNRKDVYQVSITKFIKSLYNNSLKNDGFELFTMYIIPGTYKTTVKERWGPYDPFKRTVSANPDNILSKNSIDNSKTLNLSNDVFLLICNGSMRRWGEFRNLLRCGLLCIYPDGTYTNKLYLTPYGHLNPLLTGVCMTLPIEYIPEESTH